MYPHYEWLEGMHFPGQGGKSTLYLDLEAFPGAIGVNCDAVDQGAKTSDECSAVVLGSRMIRQGRCQGVYCRNVPIPRGWVQRCDGWSFLKCCEFGLQFVAAEP